MKQHASIREMVKVLWIMIIVYIQCNDYINEHENVTDLDILMIDVAVASTRKQESVDQCIVADIGLFAVDFAESSGHVISHIVLCNIAIEKLNGCPDQKLHRISNWNNINNKVNVNLNNINVTRQPHQLCIEVHPINNVYDNSTSPYDATYYTSQPNALLPDPHNYTDPSALTIQTNTVH